MQTGSIASGAFGALNSAQSLIGLTGDQAESGNAAAHTPFAGMLKDAIQGVQSLENQAADKVQGLMTGQGVDVHQAMIATQRADMSFEMALAVRSKAVAAYQQLMQMQF